MLKFSMKLNHFANLTQLDALLACQGEMFKGLMFIFVSTTSKLGALFQEDVQRGRNGRCEDPILRNSGLDPSGLVFLW